MDGRATRGIVGINRGGMWAIVTGEAATVKTVVTAAGKSTGVIFLFAFGAVFAKIFGVTAFLTHVGSKDVVAGNLLLQIILV